MRLSTYLCLTSVSNSVLLAKNLCFHRFFIVRLLLFTFRFWFLQASSGKYLLCTFILLNISPCRGVGKILSEDEMRIALNLYDKEASELCHHTNIARWDAVTDVENKEKEAEKVSEIISMRFSDVVFIGRHCFRVLCLVCIRMHLRRIE